MWNREHEVVPTAMRRLNYTSESSINTTAAYKNFRHSESLNINVLMSKKTSHRLLNLGIIIIILSESKPLSSDFVDLNSWV